MASASSTPPVLNLSEISSSKRERFESLKSIFAGLFNGDQPEFFARAPGRVNLIGEHIDYCGYSVLPMAIEQDIVIAGSTNSSGQMRLCNVDPDTYPEHLVNDLSKVEIDSSVPHWYNYVLCGFKGIWDHFEMSSCAGMNLLVDGQVPHSAGLSSSSALVCSSALATMQANAKTLTKLELADICIKCERYVGTQSGGMDQSIAFLAEAGTAKHIEFHPTLKATDVRLPEGATFVVSNSCVPMNKAASSHYNTRVTECRLAAQILAADAGCDWKKVRTLADLQKVTGRELADMLAMVEKNLKQTAYTKEEICGLLDVSVEELDQQSFSQNTLHLTSFECYKRAKHVYGEASRVLRFKAVCDQVPPDALQQLGDLMNGSHASCRDLYHCSHPDLDQLVDICRESGAVGSRLTGAGWGGCTVSLVTGDPQTFLDQVNRKYFGRKGLDPTHSLFQTKPGGGAAIFVSSPSP